MVIVWKSYHQDSVPVRRKVKQQCGYHQDSLSASGMVKGAVQVPSVTAAGSLDGNCQERLPSRFTICQMDGKAAVRVPSETAAGSMDGNCLEGLPSRFTICQMDGKAAVRVPSEMSAGNLDGNTQRLPLLFRFVQNALYQNLSGSPN
ncbi:MAG: hypothetical protein ACOYBD_07010 [Bilifractor sp.]|jgi:hypothetical protein